MNRLEHLLFHIAEEAAEVAQRASKAAKFGIDEKQPGQDQDNYQRLVHEFVDLTAVMDMLKLETGREFSGVDADELFKAKKEKVEKYLLYSKECGTLT